MEVEAEEDHRLTCHSEEEVVEMYCHNKAEAEVERILERMNRRGLVVERINRRGLAVVVERMNRRGLLVVAAADNVDVRHLHHNCHIVDHVLHPDFGHPQRCQIGHGRPLY